MQVSHKRWFPTTAPRLKANSLQRTGKKDTFTLSFCVQRDTVTDVKDEDEDEKGYDFQSASSPKGQGFLKN